MMPERTWAIGSLDHSRDGVQRHHKKDRRKILFTLRLTEQESHLLNEAAVREDRSVSQIIRRRLFGPFGPLERRP